MSKSKDEKFPRSASRCLWRFAQSGCCDSPLSIIHHTCTQSVSARSVAKQHQPEPSTTQPVLARRSSDCDGLSLGRVCPRYLGLSCLSVQKRNPGTLLPGKDIPRRKVFEIGPCRECSSWRRTGGIPEDGDEDAHKNTSRSSEANNSGRMRKEAKGRAK